jgi:hypothetical protein
LPQAPNLAANRKFPHHRAMALFTPTESISASIQFAVAPVFLLTGIGSILNVVTTRLGRVIDRARAVEAEMLSTSICTTPQEMANARDELLTLDARMNAANMSVAACTLSLLFVCSTVAILFVGEFSPIKTSAIVAASFIAAMVCLIIGLLFFLREVRLSLQILRVKRALLKAE